MRRAGLALLLLPPLTISWELGPFVRLEHENPVLEPRRSSHFVCPRQGRAVRWEEKDVFNPAAVVKDGLVHLLYRAEDKVGRLAGTSRIGLATSTDGVHFERRPEPVLFPDVTSPWSDLEWEGGLEDPRVVESGDGRYVMTYTAYDGTARLCVATSFDLVHWTKHGPAFADAAGGAFRDAWTKSGSIVCRLENTSLVATRVQNKYWMLWGENNVHAAVSDDLIRWEPVLSDGTGGVYRGRPDHQDAPVRDAVPQPIFGPRKGRFDSDLVEPGPPAIMTDRGIVFIYNSKNKWCSNPGGACRHGENDQSIPPGTYSAGQVLLSSEDPTRVLARTDDSFFKPELDFEKTGQVANVCFLEGLVFFQGAWLLYYGTADSKIAVAKAVDPGAPTSARFAHEVCMNNTSDQASEATPEAAAHI